LDLNEFPFSMHAKIRQRKGPLVVGYIVYERHNKSNTCMIIYTHKRRRIISDAEYTEIKLLHIPPDVRKAYGVMQYSGI